MTNKFVEELRKQLLQQRLKFNAGFSGFTSSALSNYIYVAG